MKTRDSLFGEQIVWSGSSKAVSVPLTYRVVAVVGATMAVVTLSYAIVIASTLHVAVGSMVLFAAWCATLALAAWKLPRIWRSKLEYIVTDRHVIWRRGRIRRSIEKSQVSYALIRWNARHRSVGDLVLVRAVPTGALRRTLSLTLSDVEAPDRLWAIIRDVVPSAPLGHGDRPLAQRLDPGERVLWSAIPLASAWTARRAATAVLGAVVAIAFVHSLARGAPPIAKMLRLHMLPPAMLAVLVAGAALGMLLLLAVAVGVAYAAFVRPVRLARATRYFVTNERVLIRRADEELSLDRSRIAYVIDAPLFEKTDPPEPGGLHDVFLVLDGPQARALAPSGAFGGDDHGVLRPVFSAIVDAETVGELLRPSEAMKRAA
jgi:hypothetical protein